jgi:hypothetical protein
MVLPRAESPTPENGGHRHLPPVAGLVTLVLSNWMQSNVLRIKSCKAWPESEVGDIIALPLVSGVLSL